MWTRGTIEGYAYCIKHFEEGSEFGINNGRISKLHISKDGVTLANYDRGWDILPVDAEIKEVYKELVRKFN